MIPLEKMLLSLCPFPLLLSIYTREDACFSIAWVIWGGFLRVDANRRRIVVLLN